ncbi:MAG: hypothetical protein ACI30N_00855, partial [Muribaculaceae bacterium]
LHSHIYPKIMHRDFGLTQINRVSQVIDERLQAFNKNYELKQTLIAGFTAIFLYLHRHSLIKM